MLETTDVFIEVEGALYCADRSETTGAEMAYLYKGVSIINWEENKLIIDYMATDFYEEYPSKLELVYSDNGDYKVNTLIRH